MTCQEKVLTGRALSLPETMILKVDKLSKRYELDSGFGNTFREELAGLFSSRKKGKEFWALRDVSFQLERGEILGVVGKNGAGKSTLLKILSEVTPPTEGRIEFFGTCTSILDIGTGFHPDLTGRENIYLNASLLGRSKQETEKQFDAIVKFSGIGEFIDQPVKKYSDGMYLRLAFSVAFHSDVDLLLLDEVLAVGDAEFRMKSSERIQELAASGCSIIVVSHGVHDILGLCNKCLLLEDGSVAASGTPADVLEKYIGERLLNQEVAEEDEAEEVLDAKEKWDNEKIRFEGVEVAAVGKLPDEPITMDDEFECKFRFHKKSDQGTVELIMHLSDMGGTKVLADSIALQRGYITPHMPAGDYEVSCLIPANWLNRGIYTLHLTFAENMVDPFLTLMNLHSFRIHLTEGNEKNVWNERIGSTLRPNLDWEMARTDQEVMKEEAK